MSDIEDPKLVMAKHLLEDSTVRVRYQHEFSLAAFQSLILINGGAIVGLLTYAGNLKEKVAAHDLSGAFMGYVLGLVATILAYLFAYYSQGLFMQVELDHGVRLLGLSEEEPDPKDITRGRRCIVAAVCLTFAGLGAFLWGSWLAMTALGR